MAAGAPGPPALKHDGVAAIKAAVTLVDVMHKYGIETEQAGNNLKARCPFHGDGNERTPSMVLQGEGADQRYYCYACGKSGNVFNFVMEQESVDFKEAMLILANGYGVELGKWGGSGAPVKPKVSSACNRM